MMLLTCASVGAEDLRLPDPLVMLDGRRVETAEQWRSERRPELLELFRKYVYGRAPIGRPADLRFVTVDVTPGLMDGKATRKRIDLVFSGPGGPGRIRVFLLVPSDAGKPVPAFLLINHRKFDDFDPGRVMNSPFWPAERLVERGYAAVVVQAQDVDPDVDDGFKNGVHGIFDDPAKPRASDAWATIAAWAWGASRAMDYLETDPAIDASKVAVIGHSRGGKTALWCGAQDERFALVISNDSGCTGAALSRRPVGETVKKINDGFPHWFCTNYRDFNGREDALPVDQHELVALMAPRRVYVASASEDAWADPEGEFLACVYASPVYQLLGHPGVESATMPPPETPLHAGRIGYHLRTGKHDLAAYDWEQYMDFADKQWR
jgi:dienelactone hydrolase